MAASDTLKGPRAVRLFTCRGKRLHSLQSITNLLIGTQVKFKIFRNEVEK